MCKPTKKPWPAIVPGTSPFARDLHFLSDKARGIERKRRTDAEVTAFVTKGHGGIDLGLPGAVRHQRGVAQS